MSDRSALSDPGFVFIHAQIDTPPQFVEPILAHLAHSIPFQTGEVLPTPSFLIRPSSPAAHHVVHAMVRAPKRLGVSVARCIKLHGKPVPSHILSYKMSIHYSSFTLLPPIARVFIPTRYYKALNFALVSVLAVFSGSSAAAVTSFILIHWFGKANPLSTFWSTMLDFDSLTI